MRRSINPAFVLPAVAFFAAGALLAWPPRSPVADAPPAANAEACEAPGTWLDPASGERLAAQDLMASLATRKVVLLGESHTDMEHHRWQLHTLAGLKAHRSEVVVGFEMFPRSVQPALDAWPQGSLSQEAFLKEARWREVWGYDADLYLPLFHFVRQNRLPMVAMNVDRPLVSRVGAEGWAAVPAEDRQGITDPAPASEAYRLGLAEVYRTKLRHAAQRPVGRAGHDAPDNGETGELPSVSEILEKEGFQKFVEAQLTWDRAMAEAIAAVRSENPEALIVGVLGRGHAEHGHGVPHQLADLGEDDVAVLLPVEVGAECAALARDVADAVFLLAPGEEAMLVPAKPRLGIVIEPADGGVRVLEVVDGSVADTTGLAPGDVILTAASFPVTETSELVEIIQRQAPGTWLPLDVRRETESRQFVAKFPSRFQ